MRFAAIGLDHRHIYHMVGGLLEAGASCVGFDPATSDERVLAGFRERFPTLPESTADRLIASATLVEGEAVDLYHFTSVIMRSLNDEGRLRIVEMMWELVYADGRVSEFEENVVWRAADLLAVPSRDRIELKRRVAEAARQSAPDPAA